MGESPRRPIRVMHVIARMNVGGPAVEITELMRGLDPGRISQRLVTGHCGVDEADFLQTQAVDVSATRIEGLGRSIRPADDARALARLVQMIRASRPDIVHTHTAKAGVLGRVAAVIAGTGSGIVHTHHGHLLHGYFGPAKTAAVVRVERQLALVTERMVAVGVQVRDDLLEAGIGRPHQYSVIHSGVRPGPLPGRSEARRELGLPQGSAIVSMIGRLTHIKRPDRLADVAALLHAQGLDAHFVVAGGGDEQRTLSQRIEKEGLPITMLGWRSDLWRVLAATDVVLLTSDNEGTPLSLVQAGLAGVPAVATDVGSVSEVVESGVTGLLCSTSARELADALTVLIGDPELRSAMGTAAREKALLEFGVQAFLDQHAALYEAVARRRA